MNSPNYRRLKYHYKFSKELRGNYNIEIMILAVVVISLLLTLSSAFHAPFARFGRKYITCLADAPAADPLNEIRAKMASDPNYNPLSDPQAAQAIDALIPSEMKEFYNSMERFKVALTDATTGTEGVEDLDAAAASFENKKDFISTPSSAWFKEGMPDPDFSQEQKDELEAKVKAANPDIPMQ